MKNTLTDAQIDAVVREASRGSATRRDGSTATRIARAAIAAHEAAQPAPEPIYQLFYPGECAWRDVSQQAYQGFADVVHRTVYAAQEALCPADMFWNDDDADRCCDSIDEILNRAWCDNALEVGAEFTIQQAIHLPNVKIRVTAIDDDGESRYEEVPALAQAVQP